MPLDGVDGDAEPILLKGSHDPGRRPTRVTEGCQYHFFITVAHGFHEHPYLAERAFSLVGLLRQDVVL